MNTPELSRADAITAVVIAGTVNEVPKTHPYEHGAEQEIGSVLIHEHRYQKRDTTNQQTYQHWHTWPGVSCYTS